MLSGPGSQSHPCTGNVDALCHSVIPRAHSSGWQSSVYKSVESRVGTDISAALWTKTDAKPRKQRPPRKIHTSTEQQTVR